MLLAIRAVRDKERKAAAAEIASLDDMLAAERKKRIAAEVEVYNLRLLLAQHGIKEE